MTRRLPLPEECLLELDRLQTAIYQWEPKSQGRRDASDRLNVYLWALSCAGWSTGPMAVRLGVTRQAVSLRIHRVLGPIANMPDVPTAPPPPAPEPPAPYVDPLSSEEVDKLAALHQCAKRTNGATPVDHPDRAASVELAALMHELVSRGVPVSRVARAIGVTKDAVRFRLVRHGYVDGPPSVTDRYVGRPAEGRTATHTHCHRGHPMSGDNLWQGTRSDGRVVRHCRECGRAHSRTWYARHRAVAS